MQSNFNPNKAAAMAFCQNIVETFKVVLRDKNSPTIRIKLYCQIE